MPAKTKRSAAKKDSVFPRPLKLPTVAGSTPAAAETPLPTVGPKHIPVQVYYDTEEKKLVYGFNRQQVADHVLNSLGLNLNGPPIESESVNGKQ